MGATYYTPPAPRGGQSVFIATPAYEGTKPGYSYSLALTTAELVRHGIPFELGIMEGNCHVDDGRNSLVKQFLDGNCTDMLFIDADLMWEAGNALRVLSWKEDLVCGVYPFKSMSGDYPVGRILHAMPNGLLEMSYAPTGFMRIRRRVFDKLAPTQSKHGKDNPVSVFFERKFNGKTRDGGDVTFCRKWIAAGGKVLVDPNMKFTHIGEWRFSGCFAEYLKDEQNIIKHVDTEADAAPVAKTVAPGGVALKRIIGGDHSIEAFKAVSDAWGNQPWAVTPEFLKVAHALACETPEGSTILECGSGITTAILATTGRKIVSLEEHGPWADRIDGLLTEVGLEARIIVAPVDGKTGWYGVGDRLNNLGAKMVLIDGPRRDGPDGTRRDRGVVIDVWSVLAGIVDKNAVVLADDVTTMNNGGTWASLGTAERPFCVGKLKEAK